MSKPCRLCKQSTGDYPSNIGPVCSRCRGILSDETYEGQSMIGYLIESCPEAVLVLTEPVTIYRMDPVGA